MIRRNQEPADACNQSSGSTSVRTEKVIQFYSALPKGPKPDSERPGGIRGRYFEGKNASG